MTLRIRELELARGAALAVVGVPVEATLEGNDGFDRIVPPSEAQGGAGRHRRIVPQGHLVVTYAYVGEGDVALRREFEFLVLLLAGGGGRTVPPRGAQARSEDRFSPDATTDRRRRFGRRRREGAVRGGGARPAEEGSARVGGPAVNGLVVGAEGEEGMMADGIFVNVGEINEDVPSLREGGIARAGVGGRGL